MIILEYEHVIHVDKNKELSKATIQWALLDAQKTKRYAKFYCGKYYISVCFNRDQTIQFSSNFVENRKFITQLRNMENRKYKLNNVTFFLWHWLNRLRTYRG